MQLATDPIAQSVPEYREDGLKFTGAGGTFYVEPTVGGAYYVLREASPEGSRYVDRLDNRSSARWLARWKAKGLF